MHFTEDLPSGNYIINEYTAKTVTINKQCYRKSLYISANTLIEDISLVSSAELSQENVQFIVDLKPELLILGSGETLDFPPAEVIALFASQQIGFEVMDHAAACRTFAILSAEQRKVGALFLIKPEP